MPEIKLHQQLQQLTNKTSFTLTQQIDAKQLLTPKMAHKLL